MSTTRQTINHLDGVLDVSSATAHFQALLDQTKFRQLQRFQASFNETSAAEVRPDMVTCYRYLELAKWVDKDAHNYLLSTLKWRQEAGIDDFFSKPPAHAFSDRYRRARVFRRLGHDRSGNVLVFDKVGHFASSGCIDAFKPEEWWLLFAWEMECCLRDMRQMSVIRGHPVHAYTYIADCADLSLGVLWYLSMLHRYDQLATVHYPELISRVILINAPSFWVTIWNAVSLLVDKVHMDKVEVHEGVPSARLLELVDRDQLPRALGGDLDVVIPACAALQDLPPAEPVRISSSARRGGGA